VAKKSGKRSKATHPAQPSQQAPRDMFGAAPPPPRQVASPASSTPLADYLTQEWPGVDEDYVVLPRSLAQSMPLPWQQQLTSLLVQFHRAHRQLAWPDYRVVPSRRERLIDLDEEQLAGAGYLVEIDAAGEMVYRERSGRQVAEPEETVVLVPCLDPIAGQRHEPAQAESAPPQPGAAAPMNVEPPPAWPTRVAGANQGGGTTGESAGDFGPTGEPTEIPYRYRR